MQSIVNESLKIIEQRILELNREQLWEDGTVNVKQPGRREAYSRATIPIKKKHARYKKVDFITLRWDGDFYESLFIEYEPNQFTIKSNDPKWILSLEPQDRFENALGLTNESKAKLRILLRDALLTKLRTL